ncbi:hypothetical protein BG004_000987 [Podila humilis]|nr:hypothetical protein BG004_000987 [Podila humilis]
MTMLQANHVSIFDLPHIFDNIASYLNRHQLAQGIRVNRTWSKHFTPRLYSSLYCIQRTQKRIPAKGHHVIDEKFLRTLQPSTLAFISTFGTEGPAIPLILHPVSVLPRLRTLSIFWIFMAEYLTFKSVASFLDRHPKLSHFELVVDNGGQRDYDTIVAAIKQHPGLVHVRLECELTVQGVRICQILNAIQNLESFELKIFSNSYHTEAVPVDLCRQTLEGVTMVKMRHLSLYFENSTSHSAVLTNILPCCPNLESLDLDFILCPPPYSLDNPAKEVATLINKCCPGLKKFKFRGRSAEAYKLVKTCCTTGTGLEFLDIASNTFFTFPLMNMLEPSHTQSLISLVLNIASGIDPETILDILCSCPNLVTFHSHIAQGSRAPDAIETQEQSLDHRMKDPWACTNLRHLSLKFVAGQDPNDFPEEHQVDRSFLDDEDQCNITESLEVTAIGNMKQKKKDKSLLDRYLEHLVTEIGKLTQLRELKFLTTQRRRKVTLSLGKRDEGRYLDKLVSLQWLQSVYMEHGNEDEARWMIKHWSRLLHVGGFIGTKEDDLPRFLTQWKPDIDIQYRA